MAELDHTGLPNLGEACRALANGRAVVVPNPSPMTYGIAATSPHAVNALKQRPPDQNVAVSLHDDVEWQRLAPTLDMPSGLLPRIVALQRRRLSLLVPLRPDEAYPEWIDPAVRHGYVAMFDGRWGPTSILWDRFPRLYGSSANRTGQAPAASAAEAIAFVGDEAPVVDGDALRDRDSVHAPSSMVRVSSDGTLHLYRHGAQDAASGLDPDAYLRHLASYGPTDTDGGNDDDRRSANPGRDVLPRMEGKGLRHAAPDPRRRRDLPRPAR